MRRTIVLGLLLLVSGGLALVLLVGDRAPEAGRTPAAAAGVTLFGYDADGDPAWTAHAEQGDLVDHIGRLSSVVLSFPADGAGGLSVTAERLIYRTDDRRLSGGVTAERDDGLRLETDEIAWDEARGELSAGEVTMTLSDLSVRAGGFVYRIGPRRTALLDGVEATIARDRPVRVSGDAAEESDGVITVDGDVRIHSEDVAFRCARLETDAAGERIRLSGEVDGTFRGGAIAAESIEWTPAGWTARGEVSVRIDLDALQQEADDGA